MIKWDGFGKSLKQLFFILLISCFTLLGNSFVSAVGGQVHKMAVEVERNGTLVSSDGGVKFQVSGKGILLTQYLGVSRRMLAFNPSDPKVYFFWNGGKPYTYYFSTGLGISFQGFHSYYSVCDEINATTEFLSGCVNYPITDSFVEAISPFFNSITSSDYFGYNYGWYFHDVRIYFSNVCFSSSEYHQSVCFRSSNGLHGSLGLAGDISIGDISNSYLGDPPPYIGGGNIDGGSQQAQDSVITGDITYSVCTKQTALNWYNRKGYNRNLCYSNYQNDTEIFQSGQTYGAFATPGTDIIDVWFDTWNYRRYGQTGSDLGYEEWFQYWRKSWDVYKHGNGDISNPFVGVPVSLFTLMGNINSYGMSYNNASILEFCDLILLNQDLNTPYTGIASDTICNMSAIDLLADSYGVHGESGHVVQGSSWEGITNRDWSDGSPTVIPQRGTGYLTGESGSGLSFYGDGKTFENNFFNLLKTSFIYPSGSGNGVLPGYIVIAFCGVILFRFLRH